VKIQKNPAYALNKQCKKNKYILYLFYIMSSKIPFLDLSREIVPVKDELIKKMNNIIFERTDFILGKDLEIFEQNFANYITSEYCVGVANGTDALEMAVQSLDLKEDDEIITQANTYVATCFGVTNNNIKLKLVDVDANTYQMDLDELEKKITDKTKVVIVVHLTGSCCNMERLMSIVEQNDLILIEDCAQSHGAYYNNKRLGSFGVMSTHSFYPGKNLGAFGDGGAICSSNYELTHKLRKMRNNGSIEKYKHEIFGRNSRLDTLQAAVLDIKLQHLDSNNEKRRKNAQLYCELLKHVGEIQLPKIEEGCVPVYHLFIVRAYKRDELKKFLEENGVSTGIHYPISISELKCYENYFEEKCERAEKNSENILSLPMFPDLTTEEITKVCDLVIDFYIMDCPF
jgi:dTDP-4-amino-4,6-dideoxygalactose transaminase